MSDDKNSMSDNGIPEQLDRSPDNFQNLDEDNQFFYDQSEIFRNFKKKWGLNDFS